MNSLYLCYLLSQWLEEYQTNMVLPSLFFFFFFLLTKCLVIMYVIIVLMINELMYSLDVK